MSVLPVCPVCLWRWTLCTLDDVTTCSWLKWTSRCQLWCQHTRYQVPICMQYLHIHVITSWTRRLCMTSSSAVTHLWHTQQYIRSYFADFDNACMLGSLTLSWHSEDLGVSQSGCRDFWFWCQFIYLWTRRLCMKRSMEFQPLAKYITVYSSVDDTVVQQPHCMVTSTTASGI